jgi:hypothetical protein
MLNDTVRAQIKSLQVKERSGFEIKKLSANFKMTPKIMEFDQLNLKTNKSSLGPYFAMEYTNMGADFSNFISKVVMKSYLKQSVVYMDDIAYFTPTLTNLHQKINLSCQFEGTVENFVAKDLGF